MIYFASFQIIIIYYFVNIHFAFFFFFYTFQGDYCAIIYIYLCCNLFQIKRKKLNLSLVIYMSVNILFLAAIGQSRLINY